MSRVAIAVVVGTLGCMPSHTPAPWTDQDRELLRESGLTEPGVATALEPLGGPLATFDGIDDGGQPVRAAGVSVPVGMEEVEREIDRLRSALAGMDLGVFHVEQNFGFDPDRILVVRGGDPYAFLGLVRTDGINFDLEHEAVIARLREWDDRPGLDFLGGGLDWVSARFRSEPDDWAAFAREVYDFCPDVVDQGTETVERLEAEMRTSGQLYCWWD